MPEKILDAFQIAVERTGGGGDAVLAAQIAVEDVVGDPPGDADFDAAATLSLDDLGRGRQDLARVARRVSIGDVRRDERQVLLRRLEAGQRVVEGKREAHRRPPKAAGRWQARGG